MNGAWSTAGLRVAVTGATGFLGRHVTTALAEAGAQPLPIGGDVCAALRVDGPVDVVCHLAGRASGRFARDAEGGLRVNVVGTLNALELAQRSRARLVLASTCAVYRPCAGAVREDAPLGPISGYGFSKRLAESLAEAYASHRGVSVVILRLFNPYGPGQAGEYVIPYLCQAIARRDRPALQQPNSIRDFIHAHDVAEMFRRACVVTGALVALNAGSGIPCRILEAARLIATLVGRPLQWDGAPEAPDPYGEMWADMAKTHATLEWAPRMSLEAGLRLMLTAAGREART